MRARAALRCRRPTAGAGARRMFRLGVAPAGMAIALVAGQPDPPAMTTPPREGQTPESLQVTIAAPRQVRTGEPVPITIRLANLTDHPVPAYFVGRVITFDVVVARDDGTVVWRRLEGATVESILQVRTLQAHETMELRDTWRQRGNDGRQVQPGIYAVWGLLPSDAPEPRRTAVVKLRIIQ